MNDTSALSLPATGPITFTVLYTVSLRGELRLLPYLFTLIKQQKADATGPVLLVDLGESCRMDWPICRDTEGRATLVALDGMGYDVFYLGPDEPLSTDPITLPKLRDTVLTVVLLPGDSKMLTKKANEQTSLIQFVGGPDLPEPAPDVSDESVQFTICLARGLPLASRVIDARTVCIEDRREERIPSLGRVDVRVAAHLNEVEIIRQRRIPIPMGIMPDPSISSLVEFVESEAQQAGARRG